MKLTRKDIGKSLIVVGLVAIIGVTDTLTDNTVVETVGQNELVRILPERTYTTYEEPINTLEDKNVDKIKEEKDVIDDVNSPENEEGHDDSDIAPELDLPFTGDVQIEKPVEPEAHRDAEVVIHEKSTQQPSKTKVGNQGVTTEDKSRVETTQQKEPTRKEPQVNNNQAQAEQNRKAEEQRVQAENQRKQAEEQQRIKADEERKQAEIDRIAAEKKQKEQQETLLPNALYKSGQEVGSKRSSNVWYYDGSLSGLTYTTNTGDAHPITVSEPILMFENGIGLDNRDYSSLLNGHKGPTIIQKNSDGYLEVYNIYY